MGEELMRDLEMRYCDECSMTGRRTIPTGAFIVSCRNCDWDICADCQKRDEASRTCLCSCVSDSSALVFKPGRYRTTTQLDLFKIKKGTCPNTDFLSALSLGAVEESISLLNATYVDVTETQREEATGTIWAKTPGGWAKLYT